MVMMATAVLPTVRRLVDCGEGTLNEGLYIIGKLFFCGARATSPPFSSTSAAGVWCVADVVMCDPTWLRRVISMARVDYRS